MSKKYQRRDQRRETPVNIIIGERDIEIVETVYLNRVMTQDQLRKLFFLPHAQSGRGTEAAKRRLRLLYDQGYLERKVVPVLPGEGRSPNYYLLGEQGVDLLRREKGYTHLRWHKSAIDLKQEFMQHTVAVNDVLVALTLACWKNGYIREEWRSESQIKADYDYVSITGANGKRERVAVVPDAFFVVATSTGRYPCFVEVDRGTMELKRFRAKVRAYKRYYRSGGYQQRYGFTSIKVLTIVSTQTQSGGDQRLAHLKAVTEAETKAVTEAEKDENWFWFAPLSTLSEDTIFSEPVWYRVRQGKTQQLIGA